MINVSASVPAPSSVLVSNALGIAGLVGIVVAIGALAGWPWALLTFGVLAVALAVLSATAAARAEQSAVPIRKPNIAPVANVPNRPSA